MKMNEDSNKSKRTLVELMAQWIGNELERKRAEEVLALRAQEMAALYETSLDLNAQPDLSALLGRYERLSTSANGD